MLFLFMAFFSVNLFLLNMLPIPVLDGGHVMFLLIEAVRGEALSARVQEMALKVGVSALIALMGYVVFMDVWRVLARCCPRQARGAPIPDRGHALQCYFSGWGFSSSSTSRF
jgi:Zn-dependent protease